MDATNSNVAPDTQIRRRRRGKKASSELLDEIEKLSLKGMAATEIHKHLKSIPRFAGSLPSVRTIQNYIKDLTPLDPSAQWTLKKGDEDAALILPVLAAVVEKTAGQQRLSNAEAGWVATIRRAVPDLQPFEIYRLARHYLGRTERKLHCDDLDALLAYAPWRGSAAFGRWHQAVDANWVGLPAPGWALTRSYRDMLTRMGFFKMEIRAAGGDYQRLLVLQGDLETKGSSQTQEDEHGD